MRKIVILLAVVLAAVTATTTGILMAQDPSPDDWAVGLPQMNEDGSWTPEWMGVGSESGLTVGVARTADLFGDSDVYPAPVYDEDDHAVQIGWVGENGYWAIGAESPWCLDCISGTGDESADGSSYTVTDTYNEDRTITRTTTVTDADGNTQTAVEIIEEGTDGEEGPVGSTGE